MALARIRAPTGSARTAPRSRRSTPASISRRSSASTRPACDAPSIGTGSGPGKAAGEVDELEKLLKPEPIEPVSIAQALAELPRLLDPARHRRMSGAFRAVGGDKPEDR